MYLSIDQSTSSTTVFLFNKNLNLVKKISKQHKQIYYKKDWVEHDANEIYNNLYSSNVSEVRVCKNRKGQ